MLWFPPFCVCGSVFREMLPNVIFYLIPQLLWKRNVKVKNFSVKIVQIVLLAQLIKNGLRQAVKHIAVSVNQIIVRNVEFSANGFCHLISKIIYTIFYAADGLFGYTNRFAELI